MDVLIKKTFSKLTGDNNQNNNNKNNNSSINQTSGPANYVSHGLTARSI